ncbi:Hypothetical predicted protein [Paramuricea clavata]|uniref:Methyltransferase domain-containing protein n=1 Tax=Paramuricea clavata TaxID=317549 RepID=A0A6S7L6J4_PARCT|nr:Hypothetical predicted protein [Paramuricea clavata]
MSSLASALTASGKQDYRDIAKKYSETNNVQINLGLQFVALLHLRYGQTVLDMGCGTGELTAHIASQVGFDNVFGVDPDPNRLEIAHRISGSISFTLGNSTSSFPHSDEEFYDVYFSNFVFQWLNEDEKHGYLKGAVKCLKPSGRLAIHDGYDCSESISTVLKMAETAGAMKSITFVGKTTVESMLKEFGFEILLNENITHVYNFPSLEFFITWACSTFYIDEPKFRSFVNKESLRKLVDEDGTVKFNQNTYQIVARKRI